MGSSNNINMRKIAILIIILQTTLLLNLENGFATSGDNKISTALSQIKVENENRAKNISGQITNIGLMLMVMAVIHGERF